MAEKQNTPEIRFEGFTDPWEQRKLGDLISVYIAHAGPEEDVTVLTSSRDGIQKQEDHFGRLQQHDTSDWNLIPYGYCTYRNRSDDGLFTFNVNKVADRGIVSKFYPVFETPECDADFLVAYLNSSQEIRKKLFVLAVGTSQVVLSYGALKELSLLLPQNREQSAIANVLNHIDNLITLHQRKYDKLCTVKKSMLDKMFPKPGETEPEIRFEGFTDPWEQRKLGEVASEFQSGEFISATEITENGDYPVYGGNGLRGYANRYNHEGFYALIGRQGALCGNVNCADGKAYFTEHAVAVQANQCNDTGFLVYLLSRMNLGQYSGQSAQPGLAVSTLKEVETLLPSKYEQYRIGSLLKDLDSLITLHQRKLELLRNIKKSLLDRMFV